MVRTFNTALASAGMTLLRTPPEREVGEIPLRITALNTGIRESTDAPRARASGSVETSTAIALRSASSFHTSASSAKNRRVVSVSVTGSR
jgi:hypothetical protein